MPSLTAVLGQSFPANLSKASPPPPRFVSWAPAATDDALETAVPGENAAVVRGEVIVRFKPRTGRSRLHSVIEPLGGTIRALRPGAGGRGKQGAAAEESVFDQLAVVELGQDANLNQALDRIRKHPDVLYAEPNYRLRITQAAATPVIPNDFDFAQLWGLHNVGQADGVKGADIGAPGAWQYLTGDRQVTVAVLDTGIDYYHPDLADNIWLNSHDIVGNGLDDDANGLIDDIHGYDFISDDGDPMDDHGHGTHVAGTVGAVGNNGIGIAGVCWQVSLLAVKTFDETGNGEISTAIEGIRYAVANGARILNASWGNHERSQALSDAIREAHRQGALFIAAAGNDNSDALFFPGAYEHVIAVAATDAKDRRSRFSDFGSYVDVSAPGENIYSTLPNNFYGFYSGTSMSTPHVAGVAALVLSRHPEFTNDQLANILRNAVDPIAPDKYIGTGRINAASALRVNAPLPEVKLKLPATIYGDIDISGSATGNHFTRYSLEYGQGTHPTNWTSFFTSDVPVPDGTLFERFRTPDLGEGPFTFRIIAENAAGERAVERVSVQVSNVHISFPNHNDVLPARGEILLRGTVFGESRSYIIEHGAGPDPAAWSDAGVFLTTTGPASIRDGVLAVWDTRELEPNQFYSLRLIATSPSGAVTESLTRLVYLDNHLKPGWPVYVPVSGTFPGEDWRDVTVADLDRDGYAEIILVDHGNSDGKPARLLVYRHDGSLHWSRELGAGYPYFDIPVVGDISGDGYKQIFVDAGSPPQLFAFHHDGSNLQGHWPIRIEVGGLGKVLADLDGDGMKEVIGYSQDTVLRGATDHRQLVVYDADGRLLRRWEVPACSADLDAPRILPAVGNLDDEPDLEIVAVSGCESVSAFKLSRASPLWTATTYGTFAASPVIGDLDGQGTNEVIIAAFDMSGGRRGGVYAFSHDGQRLPGWPVLVEESFSAAPALGDLDGDGQLEIVLPSWKSGLLHAVRRDGFELEGWPVGPVRDSSLKSSAVIGDVNGDGRPDVVLASPGYLSEVLNNRDVSKAGGVRAWDIHGRPISLSGSQGIVPLVMEGSGGVWQKAPPATLADIDGNGRLDIVAVSIQDRTYLPPGETSARKNRSSIYVWELETPFVAQHAPWPALGGNSEHTGYLPAPPRINQPPLVAPIPSQIVPAGGEFFPVNLDQYVDDPDHSRREISWTVSGQRELTVTLSTNRVVTLRPPRAVWAGIETLRFTASDPGGASSEVSATFEARVGYVAPVAAPDRAAILEDTTGDIDVLANDRDPSGHPLAVAGLSKPGLGRVTQTAPGILRYEANPDANGTDSFSYILSNGQGGLSMGSVTVEIAPVPDSPRAGPDHVVIDEDTRAEIDVLANDSDPDDEPLRLLEFVQPENGSVSSPGAGVLVYQPKEHYFGTDQFTYLVSDGTSSTEGTVEIIVKPVNDPPVAEEQSFTLNRNASQNLIFTATDPDDTEFTFTIVDSPRNGTLWNYPKVATYYPTNGFAGSDSFTYRANDGKDDGPIATVHFTVLDANNPPQASDVSLVTKVDQPADIELSATDLDGDPLTYTIVRWPDPGRLSGSGTNYVYQPPAGFLGRDSFEFQVSDGKDSSPVARVSITVTDQNTPPVAHDSLEKVLINTPTNITLRATDPESNPLSFHLITRPLNGKLTGKGGVLLYSPNPFFVGSDRFTFRADDGELESDVATVSISVDAANHRPVATNQQVTVLKDTPLAIPLTVEDLDGDPLLCPILKGPKHGRLAGLGASFVYTPRAGFTGSDSFTYKAWDGQIYSGEAKVSITVSASLPKPVITFESVDVLATGQVRLALAIPPGVRVEVLASNDLIEWTPLPVGLVEASNPVVMDDEAAGAPIRFYRARLVEPP